MNGNALSEVREAAGETEGVPRGICKLGWEIFECCDDSIENIVVEC